MLLALKTTRAIFLTSFSSLLTLGLIKHIIVCIAKVQQLSRTAMDLPLHKSKYNTLFVNNIRSSNVHSSTLGVHHHDKGSRFYNKSRPVAS